MKRSSANAEIKRGPGQPRVDPTDTTIVVKVGIPARALKRYKREATAAGVPLAEWIRRACDAATR